MLDAVREIEAVRARDASWDGRFYYAVLTTGVFCFPSCAARPARSENLRFFDTAEAARAAGYRPCQRCRPDLPPRAQREAKAVAAACRDIEAGRLDMAPHAAAAGVGITRFGKIFQTATGLTVAGYAKSCRRKAAQAALRAGGSVTEAIYESGFGSSGRFYEAADGMLGMTPTAWRQAGAGEHIGFAVADCGFGQVLVAGTARGICAILLGDSETALREDLAQRFHRAMIAPAPADFSDLVARVVAMMAAPASGHDLPLDLRGTLFQRRVWEALRKIPRGSTVSYGALAASLGMPGGARAVASACAANQLAVAVPCHRVVGAGGELSGYRWGLKRKAALLAIERRRADPAPPPFAPPA